MVAMKRDLPFELEQQSEELECPRSMLASRAFWLGGVLSALTWAGLALAIQTL